MTLKDNTRQRLYRAERSWEAETIREGGKLQTFTTAKQAERYLRKVVGDAFDTEGVTIVLEERDKAATSKGLLGMYQGGTIHLYSDADGANNVVLLHEFVHHLTRGVAAPAHGGEFARTWLDVVEAAIGRPQRDALAEAFNAQSVIWTLPGQKAAAWKQVYRTESDWDRHISEGKPWTATLVVQGESGNEVWEGSFRRNGSTGVEAYERNAKTRKLKVIRTFDRDDLLYVQAPMHRVR